MTTMRAVRIHRFGGPDVLSLDEVPRPEPQGDEFLARVHAASVNPVDYKIRQGLFSAVTEDRLPAVLGRDLSGTVEALGTDAGPFKVGDPIYAFLSPDRGAYAEYVLVKVAEAAAKPGSLDHVQAAAVPLAGLTAWQGLFDHGGLEANQRVLIHGGAGGVGHFAVQFARARGAIVYATASGRDLEFLRELGVAEAIDYRAQRFEDVARDIDLVFDLVGGETQDRSWAVLKQGGVMVSTLGKPSDKKAAAHRARAVGYMAKPDATQLAEIGRLIDEGKVCPMVEAVFPLAEARAAQGHLENEHVRGKVVLKVAD